MRDKAEKGVKLLTPFCSHGKGPHSKYCIIGMSTEVFLFHEGVNVYCRLFYLVGEQF